MAIHSVLITGAGGGIGSALARQLVAAGDRVVLFGRKPERLETLASELGDRSLVVVGDALVEEDLNRAIAACLERFGASIAWLIAWDRSISSRSISLRPRNSLRRSRPI